MPPIYFRRRNSEFILREIIAIIFYHSFLCSPSSLELHKPNMPLVCSPKTEAFKSLFTIPFYCFPHDQVVWPFVLKASFGGAVFVNGLSPKMEIDGSRDIPSFKCSKDNKSLFLGNDVLMHVFEEKERLWGEAVMFSCNGV